MYWNDYSKISCISDNEINTHWKVYLITYLKYFSKTLSQTTQKFANHFNYRR